jgi:hypothetical protein
MAPNGEPAMRSEILRISIPVSPFPSPRSTAARWAGRRAIGALLGIWVAVATVVAAVVIAIAWDLRT